MPVVEVAGDPLRHARRAEHARRARRSGSPSPRRSRARRRSPTRETPRYGARSSARDAPVARGDLRHAGLERLRKGRARARQIREEDRAHAVRHEVAVDLFGRVRRPPADDADLASGRRREVPGRGRRGASDPRSGPCGPSPDRPPESRGRGGRRARHPSPRSSRASAKSADSRSRDSPCSPRAARRFQFGIASVGGETVEQLEVEPVEAEPDHGARSPGARGSRDATSAASTGPGTAAAAATLARVREPRESGRRSLAPAARKAPRGLRTSGRARRNRMPGDHSRRFDPSCPSVLNSAAHGGCSSAG